MEEKKEGEKERGGSTKLKEEKGREVEGPLVSLVYRIARNLGLPKNIYDVTIVVDYWNAKEINFFSVNR